MNDSGSFTTLTYLWPSLSERRRPLIVRIVKALAVADYSVAVTVATYCERRAAMTAARQDTREYRKLESRVRANAQKAAIRQSLKAYRADREKENSVAEAHS
jgi:hypothetical protein